MIYFKVCFLVFVRFFFRRFVRSQQVTYKCKLIVYISWSLPDPVADFPALRPTIDTSTLHKLMWWSAHLQIIHLQAPLCGWWPLPYWSTFFFRFLEKSTLFAWLCEFYIHPRVICESKASQLKRHHPGGSFHLPDQLTGWQHNVLSCPESLHSHHENRVLKQIFFAPLSLWHSFESSCKCKTLEEEKLWFVLWPSTLRESLDSTFKGPTRISSPLLSIHPPWHCLIPTLTVGLWVLVSHHCCNESPQTLQLKTPHSGERPMGVTAENQGVILWSLGGKILLLIFPTF